MPLGMELCYLYVIDHHGSGTLRNMVTDQIDSCINKLQQGQLRQRISIGNYTKDGDPRVTLIFIPTKDHDRNFVHVILSVIISDVHLLVCMLCLSFAN